MPAMTSGFTDSEKERIRYHLGYGSIDPGVGLSFGLPVQVQALFILDNVMNNSTAIPQATADRVRTLIAKLDRIECLLLEAVEHQLAEQLGDLRPREDAPDRIEREYYRWAMRLADTMRVPIYPFSERFRHGSGDGARNVRVIG